MQNNILTTPPIYNLSATTNQQCRNRTNKESFLKWNKYLNKIKAYPLQKKKKISETAIKTKRI